MKGNKENTQGNSLVNILFEAKSVNSSKNEQAI